MCTGLEIAAVLASTAGSALNAKMQNDAIEEQNRQNQIAMQRERQARAEEVARQKAFEASQADEVANALFETAPEKIEKKAEELADVPDNPITSAADTYNIPVLTGQVENQDVDENIGMTISKATERTRQMLRSAALLAGQGSGFNDAAQALGRMGSEVQTIGSNRRASGAVAGMETNVPAAVVSRSASPVGDLLMLGGSLGGGLIGKSVGASGARKPFQIGNIFQSNKPLSAIPWLGG